MRWMPACRPGAPPPATADRAEAVVVVMPAPRPVPRPALRAITAGLLLAFMLAIPLAGCNARPAVERRFQAFGTDVHVIVAESDPADANAAIDDIQRDFVRIGVDWYAFGTGELAHINARLEKGQASAISDDLAALLLRAQRLQRETRGYFDPGVCALVRLWRFDTQADLASANGPPPAVDVAALRAQQGTIADVRVGHGTVSASKPVCVDVGGIAKGTALVRAAAILGKHHVRSAFIDVGGSSQLAIGSHQGRDQAGRPWTIGLRDPRADRVLARLRLAPGEAVSTSGDYERAYVRNGHRYHHILDPRTGMPTSGVAGVTVVATDAELADAASTALMVAGPAGFTDLCATLAIRDALLVTADGKLLLTPSMATRLRDDNGGQLPLPLLQPQSVT